MGMLVKFLLNDYGKICDFEVYYIIKVIDSKVCRLFGKFLASGKLATFDVKSWKILHWTMTWRRLLMADVDYLQDP